MYIQTHFICATWLHQCWYSWEGSSVCAQACHTLHFSAYGLKKNMRVSVCVCVSCRPAALRILAAGLEFCLQRPAAALSLKSCTMITSMWTHLLTYDMLPDTPSCESTVCVFVHMFTQQSFITAFILKYSFLYLYIFLFFFSQVGYNS